MAKPAPPNLPKPGARKLPRLRFALESYIALYGAKQIIMADVSLCPRCQEDIPRGATSCKCGWRKRTTAKPQYQEREYIHCGFETCVDSATMRLHRPTGWVNVCQRHAEKIWSDEAREFAGAHQLRTTTEKRQYYQQRIVPKSPGVWWAEQVLERLRIGKPVSFTTETYAREALKNKSDPIDRVPGEDDE